MIKFIEDLQEPDVSRIWLSQISVVDHAYIDDKGCVRGGSFNPNFIVSGTPDPVEKVVVDFSTVKKDIKKIIDKHEDNAIKNGFDHKLWVIEGYSNVQVFDITSKGTVIIQTPAIKIELPLNAVRYIQRIDFLEPSHHLDYIGVAFANHVQEGMEKIYPNIQVDVQCINTVDEHISLNARTRPFHYVHGLKDSTSYGCQNIAHGHRSFIHVDNDNDPACFHELMAVASVLDDTVFVREDNVVQNGANTITLGYTTSQRGKFSMSLNTDAHKVVVLPTETTVEFLAAYIKQYYGGKLKAYGANAVYVSEGLSKGAVEKL